METHLPLAGSLNPAHWVMRQIRGITGHEGGDLTAFESPEGDPGWFGPQSMVWTVHAHFVSMMVGGIGSLFLQALHPRALAAVWDHSNFREDLRGRLGRTAYFIAATTYGPAHLAQRVVERVNLIHARIQGQMPDGSPYTANEPDLIEWVHLGEVLCFLEAYQRLSTAPLGPVQINQYLRETARVGMALGARHLPTTHSDLLQALEDRRPQLQLNDRTRQTHAWIRALPDQSPQPLLMRTLVDEALQTLPAWALTMMGEPVRAKEKTPLKQQGLKWLGNWIQPTLETHGVVGVARRRAAATA
jgi:uncharacterized protein (DUF2236 family)